MRTITPEDLERLAIKYGSVPEDVMHEYRLQEARRRGKCLNLDGNDADPHRGICDRCLTDEVQS